MPGLDDFLRWSYEDGLAVGALLMWWVYLFRAFARRDRRLGNIRAYAIGLWIAVAFAAAAVAEYSVSMAWAPHDGPGLWSAVAIVLALVGVVNLVALRKTGKPLV